VVLEAWSPVAENPPTYINDIDPKLPAQQAPDQRGRLALAFLYSVGSGLGLRGLGLFQHLRDSPVVLDSLALGRGLARNPTDSVPERSPARSPTCRVTFFNQSSQQSRLPSKEGVNLRWLFLIKTRSRGPVSEKKTVLFFPGCLLKSTPPPTPSFNVGVQSGSVRQER